MDQTWKDMYEAAQAVQGYRKISDYMEVGGVAAAILSESGKIYTGICVDTSSTLGICAERNAIFHMLACGESRIRRVLALGRNGEPVPPCGACRELMVQLMPGEAQKVEILLDWETAVTLKELTPNWWI